MADVRCQKHSQEVKLKVDTEEVLRKEEVWIQRIGPVDGVVVVRLSACQHRCVGVTDSVTGELSYQGGAELCPQSVSCRVIDYTRYTLTPHASAIDSLFKS